MHLENLLRAGLPGIYWVKVSREGAIQQASPNWTAHFGEHRFIDDVVDRPHWRQWPEGVVRITVHDTQGKPRALMGARIDAWVIAHRDHGEESVAERLAGLVEELDDIHRQTTKERARLTRAHEDLRALTFGISHDLKAPVRQARLMAQARIQDQEVLSLIMERLDAAQALIDRLVGYGRVGFVEPKIASFDLHELVVEVAHSFGAEPVTLDIGSLPPVRGDRALLAQVFSNIVDNSIKFRRQNRCRVRVYCVEDAVWVDDNGTGLTRQQAQSMFAPFQRYSQVAGHGLGLSLCRRIMELHGGTISGEPLQQGCRIKLAWPGLRAAPAIRSFQDAPEARERPAAHGDIGHRKAKPSSTPHEKGA